MTSDKATIVYDAKCPTCRTQISKFQSRDEDTCFEYLPKQSEELVQRYPQILEERNSRGLRLIDSAGKVHVGADAVYQIARQLRGYRLLAWMYKVPGLHMVFRGLYMLIQRKRLKTNSP